MRDVTNRIGAPEQAQGASDIGDANTADNQGIVLIVEDDPIVRAITTAALARAGYDWLEAIDMASAWALFTTRRVDLAIIDVNLPDGSGFNLAARMLRRGPVGLIHLTSRDTPDDLIHGLESGADDYIVKPVDVRELVARVGAVLRRTRRTGSDPLMLIGRWTLDLVRRELIDPSCEPVRMTRGEFDLLAALAQARNTTLSRDYLLEVVGRLENDSRSRTIDVMVSRIRRKLGDNAEAAPKIITVKGLGYRLIGPDG